ncbi:hypothetical protein EV360DRAFT_87287 [Lentinula raphanica]|nr:hypothetical protein EV360DRAFT_87287 [Lentinula raphanica]
MQMGQTYKDEHALSRLFSPLFVERKSLSFAGQRENLADLLSYSTSNIHCHLYSTYPPLPPLYDSYVSKKHLRSCQLSPLSASSLNVPPIASGLRFRIISRSPHSTTYSSSPSPSHQVPRTPSSPFMRFPHMYPLVVFGVFGLFCSVAAVPVVVTPQNLTSRAPREELTNQQWTDKAIEDIKNSFKRSSVELLRVGVTAGRFENEDEDLVRFYFNQEISTEVGFHMVRFDQGLQLPRRRDIEQKMARFVVEFEVVEGNERKTKRYRGAVLRLDEGRFIRSEEVNFGMMLPPEVQNEITLDDLNKMRERYCDSRSIEDRTEVLARRINALVEARHGRNQGRVGMVKAGFPNIHEPGRPYSAAHYTTTMDQAAKNLVSELFNKDIATGPTLLSFDPVHPYPLPGLLDLVEF